MEQSKELKAFLEYMDSHDMSCNSDVVYDTIPDDLREEFIRRLKIEPVNETDWYYVDETAYSFIANRINNRIKSCMLHMCIGKTRFGLCISLTEMLLYFIYGKEYSASVQYGIDSLYGITRDVFDMNIEEASRYSDKYIIYYHTMWFRESGYRERYLTECLIPKFL